MDVGDDDGEFHGAAAVAAVGRHDLLVDFGRLPGRNRPKMVFIRVLFSVSYV